MDLKALCESELTEQRQVLADSRDIIAATMPGIITTCIDALRSGHKLMFFGNGGSAADAQHIATELTVRYTKNRVALAALSLATDTSAITAIGNDLSYDAIFSRQIEALGKPGDVAFGISTSGQSRNVNIALKKARGMGLICTGWVGKGGGDMIGLCDPLVLIPSDTTARIQEVQIMLGHMLCAGIEQEMGLV